VARFGPTLVEFAPAKVNLTLHVSGRRRDGYHTIESLVAFAAHGDQLALVPGGVLSLKVNGRFARRAGRLGDNLVLRAARALAAAVPGLRLGRFTLTKELPVAAGLGGGSSDAAAALRLLARANAIALDDRRLAAIARGLGADVPVCLDPCARLMRGIGEKLSKPLRLPRLCCVLVNPAVALSTKAVFARYDRDPVAHRPAHRAPSDMRAIRAAIAGGRNDLEAAAIGLAPPVGAARATLAVQPGCTLSRMSGSGATCFGLFASTRAAAAAARAIAAAHPRWWVRATVLR
jgi:4-diphosphocytidyl-2-C-methyl-D-erythritol kinase